MQKMKLSSVLFSALLSVFSFAYADDKNIEMVAKAKVGETVTFGTYIQKSGEEASPISWFVIEKNDKASLLLCEKIIDVMPFNMEYTDVTWNESTIRAWLNNDFLEIAFTTDEYAAILQEHLQTASSASVSESMNIDSSDMVFLLSVDEIHQYFTDENAKDSQEDSFNSLNKNNLKYKFLSAYLSDYARTKDPKCDEEGHGYWWLRSGGSDQFNAAFVINSGHVVSSGTYVDRNNYGVRPAIWVKKL